MLIRQYELKIESSKSQRESTVRESEEVKRELCTSQKESTKAKKARKMLRAQHTAESNRKEAWREKLQS